MVYMGSKEKILDLMKYMFEREYKKKYMIDLFCGGLSVSNFALETTHFQVIANDLNNYVVSLHREIQSGAEALKQVAYDWVTREKFNDIRDNPQNYEEWYVGFVLNVWSFGCNQKDYLYAKDLEKHKQAMHMAITKDDYSLINKDETFKDYRIMEDLIGIDFAKNTNKRIAFLEHMKKFISSSKRSTHYRQLQRLQQLENLNQAEHALEANSSERYPERISFFSEDWQNMFNMLPREYLENCFVYCDPPYQNTKKYLVGSDMDYQKFWEWFRKCPYSVYVSSYTAPLDIQPLKYELKAQLLDNGKLGDNKQKKIVKEYLYWNGKGDAEPMFEDLLDFNWRKKNESEV